MIQDLTPRSLVLPLALAMCALAQVGAEAQVDEPVGPFVADVRLTLARFKADAGIASALDVNPENLPTRGLGVVIGGHWYPLRGSRVTLGLGGEFLSARDTRTLEPSAEDEPKGPTVETRLSSMASQISLNFGKKDGWSYVSGGIGSARFTAERIDRPVGDGARARTINYGGGARWFTHAHLAVSIDLRFYSISAQPATIERPAF